MDPARSGPREAAVATHPILTDILSAYEDRWSAARAWRAGGGKVAGYLCDNVPVELIAAAGLLPCRIGGQPGSSLPQFQRLIATTGRVSGFGFSQAAFEFLLNDGPRLFDYLVVPHNRKAIEEIHTKLAVLAGERPDLQLPSTYVLDRSYLQTFETSIFHRKQIGRFVEQLEAWSGSSLTEAALTASIGAYREMRALRAAVHALRLGDGPRLSGAILLRLFAAGDAMEVERHSAQLRAVLAAADDLPRLNGPRIFLAGSPFDHPHWYEAVEAAGGVVVGEDHCWGMRCIEATVREDLPPLEALFERFHHQPGCSIAYPMARNVAACLARAKACGAQAAIFPVMQGDGNHIWTVPSEVEALRDAGLPCLHLPDQTYGGPVPADAVAAFVRGLQA